MINPQQLSHEQSSRCSYQLVNYENNQNLSEEFVYLKSDISCQEFYQLFMVNNRPCMITSETGMWQHNELWTNSDNTINVEGIEDVFGSCKVSATKCYRHDDVGVKGDYEAPEVVEMTVLEYLKYWAHLGEKKSQNPWPLLYMKDWHVVKASQEGFQPYKTPEVFSSDWLNEYYEGEQDDYKFLYMGPEGTWTPFHRDVFGSYSWSANLVGTKKWRLYPPGKEMLFMKNDKIYYDPVKPGIENIDFIDILQNARDIIFVPSGWFHVVWNLCDTLSINHNFFNAANICYIWSSLLASLSCVEKEIDDLKDDDDFQTLCQNLLLCNYGMNCITFVEMVKRIAKSRVENGRSDYAKQELKVITHLFCDHLLPSTTTIKSLSSNSQFLFALESLGKVIL